MKKFVTSFVLLISCLSGLAQSYNTENNAWVNYLVRMYENAPFEGVRVVDDYDSQHLISVLSLDRGKYQDQRTMNRVASVKAMSQASTFFNGSNIDADVIIRTSEKFDGSVDTETIEVLKSKSVGYVQGLQQLTTFEVDDGKSIVYIFGCAINSRKETSTTTNKRNGK